MKTMKRHNPGAGFASHQDNSILRSKDLTRRRFLAGASTITAGLATASVFPRRARAAPRFGGKLRIARVGAATTDSLDPGTYANSFTIGLAHAYHGYLTEIGSDSSVRPSLAQGWEPSAGAKTWVFKLRKGLTFHSGKQLTSADVVASINYHRSAGSTSAAAPLVAEIQELNADGSDTVIFELNGPNADFPFSLSDYHMPIMPAADGTVDWKSGDGSGTYRLDKFEPGIRAELTRFANHWANDRGFFDAIDILGITDSNARTSALLAGSVDVIERVEPKVAGRLTTSPGVVVHSVAGNQHYTFPMSCNKAPFTDANVRRALKHAINREQLLQTVFQGYGYVGNDHPIGGGQRFYNPELDQTPYDPDKAAWYLKQAGLNSLSVELAVSDGSFPGAADAAMLFQGAAKPAGINIAVARKPVDGYWEQVWMKHPFTASQWAGRTVEDAMFTTVYHSGAPWNETFWSNERFDQLLIAARAELDESKRREMYHEMQVLLNQDGGAIIPVFASYVFATSDGIGYPETFASNLDLDGERWAERWWFK